MGHSQDPCTVSTAVSTESDDSDVKQIKAAIKKTVASRPKDWVSVLVLLTLSINCTVQRYSHVSAYSMFMGRRTNLPLDCLYGLEITPFFQRAKRRSDLLSQCEEHGPGVTRRKADND